MIARTGESPADRALTCGFGLVGVAGFEPTASSSRTKRAAKLRHTPVRVESSGRRGTVARG
jgi:hypothetical protein